MRSLKRLLPIVLVLLLAGAAWGCGSDSTSTSGTTSGETTGSSTPGSTDTESSPADLEPLDRSTPDGAVQQIWRFYQSQNLPGVISMYDPKVLKVMGKETVTGGIRNQAGSFAGGLEKIESVQDGGGGALVTWKREVPDGEPVYGSYLLVDGGKRGWIVEYDSTLSTGILNFTRATEQAKVDPKETEPPPEVTAAAVEAQSEYDSAFGAGVAEGTG
jgi:hypothetical protein